MSATNKTPNYGLPQYVAEDKPTYLGDFNKAMLDIDTNMKKIDSKATSAESTAENAQNSVDTAVEVANTAQTTAEQAKASADNTKIVADNATRTANTAKATAELAKQAADTAKTTAENAEANIEKFNLTNILEFTREDFIPVQNVDSIVSSDRKISLVYDNSKSIFKLYGSFQVVVNSTDNKAFALKVNTPFRPTKKITITNAGLYLFDNNRGIDSVSVTIDVNGDLTFFSWGQDGIALLFPCIYFNKDFGDILPSNLQELVL